MTRVDSVWPGEISKKPSFPFDQTHRPSSLRDAEGTAYSVGLLRVLGNLIFQLCSMEESGVKMYQHNKNDERKCRCLKSGADYYTDAH